MTLTTALTTLEASGLITLAQAQPELEYLFRHALVQEAAYASLVRADRRALHRATGEALERLYLDDQWSSRELTPLLARHFHEAGDFNRALKYYTLAGDHAAQQYANAEAVMHYTAALEIAKRNDIVAASPTLLKDLYLRCGRVLELSSQYEAALKLYEQLEALARQRDDRALELASLIGRATIRVTANRMHNPMEGKGLLERALVLAHQLRDRAAEAKILWNFLILNAISGGDLQERLAHGEQALTLARELNLREQMAYILNDLWYAYAGSDQWLRALTALEEGREIFRELGNLPMLSECLMGICHTYLMLGDYEQAIVHSNEAFRVGQASFNVDAQANSRIMIGWAYLERGHFAQAIQIMEEAIAIGSPVGNVSMLSFTRADLGWVFGGLLGAVDRGILLARQARAAAEEKFPIGASWALAVLVRLHLLKGEFAEAEKIAQALGPHRDLKQKLGFIVPLWASAALAHAELALAQSDHARTIAVMDDFASDLRGAGLRLFLPDAFYLKAQALLGQQLTRIGQARTVLEDARAEAEALGSRRMLWRILMTLSEIEEDAGNLPETQLLRAQARAIVEDIAAHSPPDLQSTFLSLPDVRAALIEDHR